MTYPGKARRIYTAISGLAGIPRCINCAWWAFRSRFLPCAWVILLLLLIPLEDTLPGGAGSAYDYAVQLFQCSDLTKSQREAELGSWQFQASSPEWAARFQLLQAETLVRRGMYTDALRLLAGFHTDPDHLDETIRKLAIEADALMREKATSAASQRLAQAESLCQATTSASCGFVFRTYGILAGRLGQTAAARQYFYESLLFAQAYRDPWSEFGALNNLGFSAMQAGRYDEAVDWLRSAHQDAVNLQSDYWTKLVDGNLGWAYYQLGDDERALELFLEAKESAARQGNIHEELTWITTSGYVYHDTGDKEQAKQSYLQALYLAKQINSKEDIVNALEDLARVSVETSKLDEASAYLDQISSMERAGGNQLNGYVIVTQGMLAAARHQDQQAKILFSKVQHNLTNPTTTRLGAGIGLAELLESEGDTQAAEQTYKTTLVTFEAARAELKHVDSRLPFSANATGIYDDYIHLLVAEGRGDEALAEADRSRARTLTQGLGLDAAPSAHPAVLDPKKIARQTGATLLFYWLGEKQSYLWAVTPDKVSLFPLPARKEIVARVESYRKALLDGEDPQQDANADGQALYQLLVAPAARLIHAQAPVMILADGALSQLNFETLLVPNPKPHYWIEDATLLSAPSLELLAAAKPAPQANRELLLLGNPVSPNADYPSLPLFGAEMNQIARHFSPHRAAVFAGGQATPAAYLTANPAQYTYIHFVSHAIASHTDPLDSAIILSGAALSAGEPSFKLYARDIMQHPIQARLVTISACYGSGKRSYAGEGLVGLSWAFLRAGAQSVVGALWEVSDDSTPHLMDTLYRGLQEGHPPAAALRNAKLDLLHSRGRYRLPFYWAPFQLYTRH
jgi:CHAT domain-containing protein/Flp pilus assembly protein TadD